MFAKIPDPKQMGTRTDQIQAVFSVSKEQVCIPRRKKKKSHAHTKNEIVFLSAPILRYQHPNNKNFQPG